MIKVLILALFLFITGCVPQKIVDSEYIAAHKDQKTSLLEIIQTDPSDNVSDFVQKMPKSDFIKRGVVHFFKSTLQKIIDTGVTDFDMDDNTLAVLKKDVIKLSQSSCKSLLNKYSLLKIYIHKGTIYGESADNVVIYDIANCGIILKIPKRGYSFRPGGDKFILSQNRNFKILNIDGNEHLSGNLFKKIKDAHIADNYLFLLDVDNNFVTVDIPNKVMLPAQKIDAENIHFGRDNIFIQKDGKISLYDYKDISHHTHKYDPEKCYLNGYNSFCTSFKKEQDMDKILKYDNYLIIKNKDTVKSLSLNKKAYKKTISLSEYKPKACRENDYIIFYDIDHTIKKIDLSNYSAKIVSRNVKCENPLFYRLGEFYHKDTPILKIGEIVNRDEKDTMLMRKIDEDNIYIFFETVPKSLWVSGNPLTSQF